MTTNKNLHSAKKQKNDEFYTQIKDIEQELIHYEHHFYEKIIYLNCDDPRSSEFWNFFVQKFKDYHLKKLIATHYGSNFIYEIDATDTQHTIIAPFSSNGDFRSKPCIKLLQETDIIVTNPPFSLFREYMAQLIKYNKKFLIIGNLNAATYKEIFPLIRNNQIWLGHNAGEMAFKVPNDTKPKATRYWQDKFGQKWQSLGNACWFTNIDIQKRHEPLPLFRQYEDDPSKYPKYDNYDAINVDRVANIPIDYIGVMGVPITFLSKYCPEQFDIVTFRKNIDTNENVAFTRKQEKLFNHTFKCLITNKPISQNNNTNKDIDFFIRYICSHPELIKITQAAQNIEPIEIFFEFDADGIHRLKLKGKEIFKRILIRKR